MGVAEHRERFQRDFPIGSRCRVHDGTRATVLGTVESHGVVLVGVRLDDGRLIYHYDHDVFSPEEGDE